MSRANLPTNRSASQPSTLETNPLHQEQKDKADFLFISAPFARNSDLETIDFILEKSGLKSIKSGDGIQRLDIEALKNEIRHRLNPAGHALMVGHGGVFEDEHYFRIANPGHMKLTKDLLQLAAINNPETSQKIGPTFHAVTCHARNLHKEIKPGSPEWQRGYVFIYSSSKPVVIESTADSLEAMMQYLADCKKRLIEADPLSIFIHLTKTQGDCVTLLGGDLHAPLVSHAPKTPLDQTESGRQSRIKGDARDLHLLQKRKEEMGAESEQNQLEKRRQLRSMLHARIDRNDIDAVRKILAAHPNFIFSKDSSEASLLFTCCSIGNGEMAELLLKLGAKINDLDADEYTPLIVAVLGGHQRTVSMLLDNGADIALKNRYGDNALIKAIDKRNKEMVKLLLEKGAEKTINDTNRKGETALILAAEKGMASTVKLLLKAGANPDIKNKEGMTALHLVNRNNFSATAELLMQFQKQQNLSRTVNELQISPFNS